MDNLITANQILSENIWGLSGYIPQNSKEKCGHILCKRLGGGCSQPSPSNQLVFWVSRTTAM